MSRSTSITLTLTGGHALRGTCRVPGDKSISHRALILGALAAGRSHVTRFLDGHDCLATLAVMRALGVAIERRGPTTLVIDSGGLEALREPLDVLDCANSGTTMRLMTGLLAGCPFHSVLTGTRQLRGRPMARVVAPLNAMGADIAGRDGGRYAPLSVRGRRLRGGEHRPAVASAQVKSALLLAGLGADGPVEVVEPGPARDHTERMLLAMGAPLTVDGQRVRIEPLREPLRPLQLEVPGDISSAAFLIVAASVVPGSDVLLEGVGVNPTRTGLLDALGEMGADIEIHPRETTGGEPVADLRVRHAELRGIELGGDTVVRMIDEIPVFAVAASQAIGRTVVRDAAELRVKETDRIATTVELLEALGATLEATPDGLVVDGPCALRPARVSSRGDHRLAMAAAVAGLTVAGDVHVEHAEVFADSFPGFDTTLAALGAAIATSPPEAM